MKHLFLFVTLTCVNCSSQNTTPATPEPAQAASADASQPLSQDSETANVPDAEPVPGSDGDAGATEEPDHHIEPNNTSRSNGKGRSNHSNRGNWANKGLRHHRPDCTAPNQSTDPHMILLDLKNPTRTNREKLQKRLAKEGYAVEIDGDSLLLTVNNSQLHRLFRARIRYKSLPASSRDGWVCTPTLEGGRIPGRYKNAIRSISIDPMLY